MERAPISFEEPSDSSHEEHLCRFTLIISETWTGICNRETVVRDERKRESRSGDWERVPPLRSRDYRSPSNLVRSEFPFLAGNGRWRLPIDAQTSLSVHDHPVPHERPISSSIHSQDALDLVFYVECVNKMYAPRTATKVYKRAFSPPSSSTHPSILFPPTFTGE
jgi:hypothetical protein